MEGSGSVSCPIADFGISDVEPSDTTLLVCRLQIVLYAFRNSDSHTRTHFLSVLTLIEAKNTTSKTKRHHPFKCMYNRFYRFHESCCKRLYQAHKHLFCKVYLRSASVSTQFTSDKFVYRQTQFSFRSQVYRRSTLVHYVKKRSITRFSYAKCDAGFSIGIHGAENHESHRLFVCTDSDGLT